VNKDKIWKYSGCIVNFHLGVGDESARLTNFRASPDPAVNRTHYLPYDMKCPVS